jgi:hypothetical protein
MFVEYSMEFTVIQLSTLKWVIRDSLFISAINLSGQTGRVFATHGASSEAKA